MAAIQNEASEVVAIADIFPGHIILTGRSVCDDFSGLKCMIGESDST